MSVRVETARTVDEVRAFRDAWLALGALDVNADLDVFLAMLETRRGALRPHVLLASTDDGPRALLVARIERTTVPARLGYKTLYSPEVRALTVVQGGLLGPRDDGVAGLLFEEARGALARGEADVLRLRRVRVGSGLHGLAHRRPSWLTRGRASQPTLRWQLRLPPSLDDVLRAQSTRTRGNHRRYARKLEEEFGARLSFDVFRDQADLEHVIDACESVSVKTYQHRIGGGFAADPSERRLVELGAERGWLRAYVLSIEGDPVAFWLGLAYRGTFFTGPTGYDPRLAQWRLGTYVLMKMLEDLSADEAVDRVDYGIGGAEYKRHFGSESWLEEDALVFAPSVRGVRVNLTRTAILDAVLLARAMVARTPLLRRLKRRWRTRLSAPVGDGAGTRRPWPQHRVLAPLALALGLVAATMLGLAALDRPATTAHEEVVVDAPRHVVWELLSDFEGYDSWNPFITEARGDSDRGETVSMQLEARGERPREVECEVLVARELRKLHWRCRTHAPGVLDREHTFRVVPLGADRVLLVYDGRWEGFLQPFADLDARKRGYESMTRALKRQAERSS
jgi:CelD/BcsL family acetyltransferase involved in cellulose biosynthesis